MYGVSVEKGSIKWSAYEFRSLRKIIVSYGACDESTRVRRLKVGERMCAWRALGG